ncbi:MAG TPA: hypothetical protein VM386_02630, partial [Acidimicrobiales bacterium]|nr:hypothetical protein [Acidimicrobiales bacterium]
LSLAPTRQRAPAVQVMVPVTRTVPFPSKTAVSSTSMFWMVPWAAHAVPCNRNKLLTAIPTATSRFICSPRALADDPADVSMSLVTLAPFEESRRGSGTL